MALAQHLRIKEFVDPKAATKVLQVLSIALMGLSALLHSLAIAIDIPTFHLDGAFQTASGLFRLAAGQAPGRDFLPYLGIGPLASIYPIFILLGSDLAASVASAQFITLVATGFSISVIWRLIFFDRSFLASLVAGGIFMVALWNISPLLSSPVI